MFLPVKKSENDFSCTYFLIPAPDYMTCIREEVFSNVAVKT